MSGTAPPAINKVERTEKSKPGIGSLITGSLRRLAVGCRTGTCVLVFPELDNKGQVTLCDVGVSPSGCDTAHVGQDFGVHQIAFKQVAEV